MPVVGTPIPTAELVPLACDSPAQLTANVARYYGVELLSKRRSIFVQQGQFADFYVTMFDVDSNPADLELCEDTIIEFRVREVISCNTSDIYEISGSVFSSTEGIVTGTLPAEIANNPGIYLLEAGILNDDEELLHSNSLYLWINRGLFGTPTRGYGGPPALDDVRIYLHDNAPEENLLIDDFEFDLADICHAGERCVRHWNESQPPVMVSYKTTTYPFRDSWLLGLSGWLYSSVASRYLRNTLPYQAGGNSIDDLNKWQPYLTIGAQRIEEYKRFVLLKKAQINCDAAVSSQGSPYHPYSYGYLWNR